MNISRLNEEVFSIKREIQDAKSDLEKYKLDADIIKQIYEVHNV